MTRDELEKHTVRFLRTATGTRPDLRVVEIRGQRVVVKDFRGSDVLFRLFIGPILIGREARALNLLQGIDCVPQLVARIDRYALAIEYIDAPSLPHCTTRPTSDYFDCIYDVIHQIHARGVVHCDLRSSSNVLCDAAGQPWIVDFGASITRGRGWNPLVSFLFRQFVATDVHAVLILKRKHAPELLTPQEWVLEKQPLPFERLGKAIGKAIRVITRRVFARERPSTVGRFSESPAKVVDKEP